MPNSHFTSCFWFLFQGLAVLCLYLAVSAAPAEDGPAIAGLTVFGAFSSLVFCMFSSIFALLALSFSLNERAGRTLTLLTAGVCALLLFANALLLVLRTGFESQSEPALAAAMIMVLRAFGVAILPPRGDRSGLTEALCSFGLAILSGAIWYVLDPAVAPAAIATSLLLSWPQLVDGINAFADKIFHKAALASGARDLSPCAFTAIGRARNIVIDKAAVMSGPDLMVTNVMAFNNEPKTLLAVAASAEAQSSHPVALALKQLAVQWRVAVKTPDRFEPAPGLGVVALLGGQTVVIGTTDLLRRLKIDSFTADAIARSLEADGKTVLRVAVGGRIVGVLGLEGTLRQDAGVAGMALRVEGLTPWLFTNDSPKTREALAGTLGVNLLEDPEPGETAHSAAARVFRNEPSLTLTLSKDRSRLELHASAAEQASGRGPGIETLPLAVSDTDDIGAFPALKALAMRRNLLALRARRLLGGLWLLGGLCGGLAFAPLYVGPLLFLICLAILSVFARFSVAQTLTRSP